MNNTHPAAVIKVPVGLAEAWAVNVLCAAGAREDVARATSAGLCWASLRGIDSHGVRLLPHYVAGLRGGRINPDPNFESYRTGQATAIIDADHTFGHAVGVKAMELAVRLSADAGAGHVVVRNSSHCGAMGFFAEMACEDDMIGFAATHATARVRSSGGRRPFFGNNPFCVAAPMEREGPICYDAAQTAITFNEVRRLKELEGRLPDAAAADDKGNVTTDPAAAQQLLPIGDYKGFGLAMVVDVFCALLSGMAFGPDVSQMFDGRVDQPRRLGHYFAAIRIDAFQPPDIFRRRMTEMVQRVRVEPPMEPGGRVMVPGDPEKAAAAERSGRGIPLPASVMESLDLLADTVGISRLNQNEER